MTQDFAKEDAPTYLHRGRRFDILRRQDATHNRRLIVKQLVDVENRGNADALADARNEALILERLRGLPGCPHLVSFDATNGTLLLEDFDGAALDNCGLLGEINLDNFLNIAQQIASTLAKIHDRGVIHKDLNPANILIQKNTLQVQIIDFDLATTIAEEHKDFGELHGLLGTLAYLSPEQTGRMNRPVDYRTDLYALGATLYSLACGEPPFLETDAIALVHAHLARAPNSPQILAPWLPEPAARLILTLLDKEPDRRYQSATGVAFDLAAIQRCVQMGGDFAGFTLQSADSALAPRPPRRLYGRTRELAYLNEALEAAFTGCSSALFVSGYSGIGKTSIIKEVFRPLTLRTGLFISGKFNQYQTDRPFFAPLEALSQLCHLLMAEDASSIARWRHRLLKGIATEIAALFELLPELARLLGPQPPVVELGPLESTIRLRGLLVALVQRIASTDYPLVFFLDDLQWADQPSLDFIAELLQAQDSGGLLLIGAYRDNEIDATHPLQILLRRPRADGGVPVLKLSNLSVGDTAQMVGDMLHKSSDAVKTLAEVIHNKTAGNPYFTFEFLKALCRDGSLQRDSVSGVWRWDESLIAAYPSSDNVVDFLTTQLATLPTDTRETLVIAACLDSELTLEVLECASGLSIQKLLTLLQPALELGLLICTNVTLFHKAEPQASFRFCHDRMQQAAYQLQDQEQRALIHLNIGRRFAKAGIGAENPLGVALHYAQAIALINETCEREQVRALLHRAAIQARRAGAFTLAKRFARLGITLLPTQPWHGASGDCFALHTELHLLLFCLGRSSDADAVYQNLFDHADTALQLTEPTCIQLSNLASRGRMTDAVDLGGELLRRLDMPIPLGDLTANVQRDLDNIYAHVADGRLECLENSPILRDERLLAVSKLMSQLVSSSSFSSPILGYWLSVRQALIWLDHGYCADALSGMLYLITATVFLRGDYHIGGLAGFRALAAASGREPDIQLALPRHLFLVFHQHWVEPLENGLSMARQSFQDLVRVTDLENACYTFYNVMVIQIETAPLSHLLEEFPSIKRFVEKSKNQHFQHVIRTVEQLLISLTGVVDTPDSSGSMLFDESAHCRDPAASKTALGVYYYYRALNACLFNDQEALQRYLGLALDLTSYTTAYYLGEVMVRFLHSLSLINRLQASNTTEPEHKVWLQEIAANQTFLDARAQDAPMNFRHLHELVEAERLAVQGERWAALQRFEQAIRLAQAHQRPWHHALATERTGLYHLQHGLERSGRALLAHAQKLYLEWGAENKAQHMAAIHLFLGGSPGIAFRSSRSGKRSSNDFGGSYDQIDFAAVLRISQALASEISQPRLVARVVELLGQLTGATGVLLLLLDEAGVWFLESGLQGDIVIARHALEQATDQGLLAASVLRFGLHSGEPFVSEDAVIDSRFCHDPYFIKQSCCSLLGLPIVVRDQIGAMVILENRLCRGAFTVDRVSTVTMLARQLAISIENASLYNDLEYKVETRTQALHQSNNELKDTLSTLKQTQKQLIESEKMAALGGLVAGVAHEINTPVGVGVTASSYLYDSATQFVQRYKQGKMKKTDLEDFLENSEKTSLMILKNLEKAANLIQSFKQVAVDQSSEVKRRFNLKTYLDEILTSLTPAFKNSAITCEIECLDIIEIDSYPGPISQIITNLIMNALVHAYPEGQSGKITISVAINGDLLSLKFSDDGKGIPEAFISKIFDPFFTTRRGSGGSGLGLNIVYNLVTQTLKGTITCSSVEGKGTCFILCWPNTQ